MPAAAATATAVAPEAPKKKKGKKWLFIVLGVVVLALIGAAAALFILKQNTADDAYEDGEEPVAEHSSEPRTPPVFLSLENLVINLADPGGNRFIQLGLTLQLQDTATETAVKAYLPSIRSNVLVLVSQRSAEELLLLQGKEKLARDIVTTISREMGYEIPQAAGGEGAAAKRRARAATSNPVQAVLFSSFIVQ